MCTVSFYRNEQQVIITSNRDEHIDRPLAIFPKKYIINNKSFFYPKDPKAGGTWFVVTKKGSVFVLLNGANEKHIVKSNYRKSRGTILLELVATNDFLKSWEIIDLEGIEPFTIIGFTKQNFSQMRWDGISKSLESLDNSKARIWSSATLYSQDIIKKREIWFSNFLNEKLGAKDLIHFHTKTEIDNLENGLMIDRNKKMLTKNLTQCIVDKNKFTITHFDYVTNKNSQILENIL